MSLTSATSSPIHVGQVLAGKYRVESLLGDGGMGVVVGAVNVLLDQPVAIKLLNAAAGSDPGIVARFLREGRAAARLRSEHIARVLDCGTFEDGRPYLVTERLVGVDLQRLIEAKEYLPVEEAVDFVMQACEGLAEAHAAGIVHRDLKPANLFLTETVSGRSLVKILDFGICKLAADRESPSLTRANELLGTPRYMSPEQLGASRDTDARTDIWALGVILYELVTKRSPFQGDRLPALMAAVTRETPPPMHELRSDVPAELSAIALRCLEKRREDRFRDVLELSLALAEHGLGRRPSTPLRLFSSGSTLAAAAASSTEIRADERIAAEPVTTSFVSGAPSTPRMGSGDGGTLVSAQDPPRPGDLAAGVLGSVPPLSPVVSSPRGGVPAAPAPPLVLAEAPREPGTGESGEHVVLRRFGKYVMHAPLARGGMASVSYGCALEDGSLRPVALKRVRSELTDPNFAAMLADEARIAARVHHPNVVGTFDVILHEGEPMIALEYVPGVSLSQLLRTLRARNAPMPLPVAAAIAVQALSGLHAAHEAVDLAGQPLEIVHRDVSPANILLDERGVAKIADFGVARARGRMQQTTETGAMKGKLGYLAPEQIHGRASRASDLYAVGVVLWEMLAGRPLFEGVGGEVLAAALLGNVRPPSTAGRAEAAVLDGVVMKALEHEPSRRYATAQQMADAIMAAIAPASQAEVAAFLAANVAPELAQRRAAVQTMLEAVTRADFDAGHAAAPAREQVATDGAPARRRPRRWIAAIAAVVALPAAVLAAVVFGAGATGRPASEASPTTTTAAASVEAPSATTTAAASVEAPSATPAPSASVAPIASVEAEPEPLDPAPAPHDPSPVASSTKPTPASRLSPRPKKPPVKHASCSPPYVVTPEGRTIWKRECFQK